MRDTQPTHAHECRTCFARSGSQSPNPPPYRSTKNAAMLLQYAKAEVATISAAVDSTTQYLRLYRDDDESEIAPVTVRNSDSTDKHQVTVITDEGLCHQSAYGACEPHKTGDLLRYTQRQQERGSVSGDEAPLRNNVWSNQLLYSP